MLIDESYFVGELHIDGLVHSEGVPSRTMEAIKNELIALARKYEKDYYDLIIGRSNAGLFMSFLDLMEKDRGKATDKKWLDLAEMLIDKEGGRKESPIAYYIFFFYLRKNQLEVTPLGTVEADAKIAPCNRKMIDVWNQMVYMNEYLSQWLFDRRGEYGGYFFNENLLEPINAFGI